MGTDLSVCVRNPFDEVGGTCLTTHVCMHFCLAGQVTAVMGPPGSGRTSLLAALSSKVEGTVQADVTVNGTTGSLQDVAHLVGYVPKEDALHDDLTIKETLLFYSHLSTAD